MPSRLAATELSFQLLIHLSRQADGRLLRDLGFTNPDIERLRGLDPGQLDHLARFSHRYLQLTFDPPGFARALARVRDQRESERLQEAFIRRQAPAGMMRHLFGMNRNDFAAWRRRLGVHRRGRPPAPDEAQVAWLYRRWGETCSLPPVRRYLILAAESDLPLASIWSVVRGFRDPHPRIEAASSAGRRS
ncbi:MAG: STY4526/YPO1902 family pathogenicity island replication protein [Candidatus Competibacteraceae bacterium]|nr:STY4526/YPO1902 family pathogenicity island replication protein [Candidatus Competibacteraceae bacterium]